MHLNENNKRRTILKELDDLKIKDYTFSGGHILGSMCTQPHPIAIEAYIKFLDTNLGDPELFPGTKQIEKKLIQFIKNLLKAPKNSSGQITSGGTEGNITAMWIAKKTSGNNEIILPKSAHFSFKKISSLMNMKLIDIQLSKDYTMNTNQIKKKINKNTAAILGIAGSTELGTIDKIPEISDICYDENVFFHVDAAFGGYIIPFLKELKYDVSNFDFSLKGVSSISIDSHKMGCSAIPLGALVVRQENWFDEISVESPYISIKKHTGILGTRSGGPVAAAYAVSRYLGFEGYKNVVKKCMDVTDYTKNKLNDIGVDLLIEPTMNVIAVKLSDPEHVAKKLSNYGWRVNSMNRLSCIRIVIMPQITKKIIDEFIPVFKRSCKEVGEL